MYSMSITLILLDFVLDECLHRHYVSRDRPRLSWAHHGRQDMKRTKRTTKATKAKTFPLKDETFPPRDRAFLHELASDAVSLGIWGRAEVLPVSRSYLHLCRQM